MLVVKCIQKSTSKGSCRLVNHSLGTCRPRKHNTICLFIVTAAFSLHSPRTCVTALKCLIQIPAVTTASPDRVSFQSLHNCSEGEFRSRSERFHRWGYVAHAFFVRVRRPQLSHFCSRHVRHALCEPMPAHTRHHSAPDACKLLLASERMTWTRKIMANHRRAQLTSEALLCDTGLHAWKSGAGVICPQCGAPRWWAGAYGSQGTKIKAPIPTDERPRSW